MANDAPRCGVTGLGPRAGEAWPTFARLTADDCEAIAKAKPFADAGASWPAGRPPQPGLYAVCEDVARWLRPRVAKRLGKELGQLTRNDLC